MEKVPLKYCGKYKSKPPSKQIQNYIYYHVFGFENQWECDDGVTNHGNCRVFHENLPKSWSVV